jgi:hypothetical protein
MQLLDQKIRFETEVGQLEIGTTPDSLYYFEFLDGYSAGLHNAEPLKTFDAAYRAARKAIANEKQNWKFEI